MKPAFSAAKRLSLIIGLAVPFISVAALSGSGSLHSGVPDSGQNVSDVSAPAPAGPLFPESLRRFDMICETEGRVSGGRHSGQFSSGPAHWPDSWHSEFRESVDLELMQSCTTPCGNSARNVVAASDAERIVFSEGETYSRWVRRSDGRYMRRLDADGTIDEETGYCRPWGFTELTAAHVTVLPPKPGAEKLGLVIDYSLHHAVPEHSVDAPAFPAGMRRFDIFCAVRSTEDEPLWWPIDEAPGVIDDFWIGDLRLTINLDSGRSCRRWCDGGPMDRAVVADAERITFQGQPGITSWLDRITGYYRTRRETYGRVEESRGYCQPQPFTEAAVEDVNSRRQKS